MNYSIQPALVGDAPYIAKAVMMAVGDEIIEDFAGGTDRVPLLRKVFERLAARDDSQYSYRNSVVARTDDGAIAGVLVCYDGALLHQLRRAFFEETLELLGKDCDGKMADETPPDQIYIDTVAVMPDFRCHGIATAMIEHVCAAYANQPKPIGLLVEPENKRAYSLYTSLGFRRIGQREFAGTMMWHMIRDLK